MFWIALRSGNPREHRGSAAGRFEDGVGSLMVEDDDERKEGEDGEKVKGEGVREVREVYVVGHLALDKEDFAGQHYGDLDTGLTEDDGSVLTITTLFGKRRSSQIILCIQALAYLHSHSRTSTNTPPSPSRLPLRRTSRLGNARATEIR